FLSFQTLFIPNVPTDVGLSPPYNSMFTLFGQFFDHGIDQTVKGGGTVFVPLRSDDPLIAGADHVLGTADDLPPPHPRRPPAPAALQGAHAGEEPARAGRPPRHRGRRPGRAEHRHAVRRPV